MQTQVSLQSDIKPTDRWIIYQSKDPTIQLFKAYPQQLKNLFKFTLIISLSCLIITLMSPLTIIIMLGLIVAVMRLGRISYQQIRNQGIANFFPSTIKQLLFQKSIFDIYSDLIYFPTLSKIIAAFIRPIVMKPDPNNLWQAFQQLPLSTQENISRKGMLSLLPNKVEKMVINHQSAQRLPTQYGKPSYQWYNIQKYKNQQQKVHQQRFLLKLIEKIDNKISWPKFLIISSIILVVVCKIKPNKVKKIIIQNSCFAATLFTIFVTIVKIKKIQYKQTIKLRNQQIANSLLNKE